MKKEENLQNNLLKALTEHKPLIMNLGDGCILHMKWNKEKEMYQDEMGFTTMDLILQIINGEIEIDGTKVLIEEDYEI